MSETYHNFLRQQEQRVLEANQETWKLIKTHLPEFADFMIELSKEMGKPEKVTIEVHGNDTRRS